MIYFALSIAWIVGAFVFLRLGNLGDWLLMLTDPRHLPEPSWFWPWVVFVLYIIFWPVLLVLKVWEFIKS